MHCHDTDIGASQTVLEGEPNTSSVSTLSLFPSALTREMLYQGMRPQIGGALPDPSAISANGSGRVLLGTGLVTPPDLIMGLVGSFL